MLRNLGGKTAWHRICAVSGKFDLEAETRTDASPPDHLTEASTIFQLCPHEIGSSSRIRVNGLQKLQSVEYVRFAGAIRAHEHSQSSGAQLDVLQTSEVLDCDTGDHVLIVSLVRAAQSTCEREHDLGAAD